MTNSSPGCVTSLLLAGAPSPGEHGGGQGDTLKNGTDPFGRDN